MDNLDRLDLAKGGPMRIRFMGRDILLPDPASLGYQELLGAIAAGQVPVELPAGATIRALRILFERWSAHYDLPDFVNAQRLAYVVDHYTEALSYDLLSRFGVDLGEAWRSRRWRTLLGLIDRLPGHSWYSASVSGDADHAAALAESIARREAEGGTKESIPSGPSWVTWTPEVDALTNIAEAIDSLTYVTVAANSETAPSPPAPRPRPTSPLESALRRRRFDERKREHESLVARVLPHKAQSKD